jgi:hypothetical protein
LKRKFVYAAAISIAPLNVRLRYELGKYFRNRMAEGD